MHPSYVPTVYVQRWLEPPQVSHAVFVPVQYDSEVAELNGCEVRVVFATGPALGRTERAVVWLALLDRATGVVRFAVAADRFCSQSARFVPVLATSPLA